MSAQLCAIAAAAALAITVPFSAPAHAADNDGCSDATLNGDYAFVVSGQIFSATGTTLRQGVANTHFNGHGYLTQEDFVISTPPDGISAPLPGVVDSTTGFHTNETGTYVVNSDCTGNAVLKFPAPPIPNATGAVINLMFVLNDHGRVIHMVVSSLTPPSNQPAILGASIHSDGWKQNLADRYPD